MDKVISFGWSAPKFSEQLPQLSNKDQQFADRMNDSITFLALHGIITSNERNRAIARATKHITNVLNQMKV